jgi:hypothetical protein
MKSVLISVTLIQQGAEARPRTPTAVPDMPRVIPPGHDGNSTDIPRAAGKEELGGTVLNRKI